MSGMGNRDGVVDMDGVEGYGIFFKWVVGLEIGYYTLYQLCRGISIT